MTIKSVIKRHIPYSYRDYEMLNTTKNRMSFRGKKITYFLKSWTCLSQYLFKIYWWVHNKDIFKGQKHTNGDITGIMFWSFNVFTANSKCSTWDNWTRRLYHQSLLYYHIFIHYAYSTCMLQPIWLTILKIHECSAQCIIFVQLHSKHLTRALAYRRVHSRARRAD